MRRAPPVVTPVNPAGSKQDNSKILTPWQRPRLIVESPAKEFRISLFNLVALNGLGRLIENSSVPKRTSQFDVLGVRPNQRACRPGGLSAEQFQGGDIIGIPHLLGQKTALVCRFFDGLEQSF